MKTFLYLSLAFALNGIIGMCLVKMDIFYGSIVFLVLSLLIAWRCCWEEEFDRRHPEPFSIEWYW